MTKGLKFSLLAAAVLVAVIAGAIVFVPPQRALSVAIMRDCIGVVKDKVRGAGAVGIISVAAIQPDPNKRKLEDFGRATQAVISRGDMIPSEPEVVVEFETSRGVGNALCIYQADLWKGSGTYKSVTVREVQIGLHSLTDVDVLLMESFRVGYFDRVFSLFPIVGTKQKFFLD